MFHMRSFVGNKMLSPISRIDSEMPRNQFCCLFANIPLGFLVAGLGGGRGRILILLKHSDRKRSRHW